MYFPSTESHSLNMVAIWAKISLLMTKCSYFFYEHTRLEVKMEGANSFSK